MDTYQLTMILVCLIFSAFFSGTEIAFVSASKLQIELQSQQGKLAGRILAFFTQKPSRLINTALVGNTIALVIYGIFMASVLEPWIANKLPENLNSQSTVVILQTLLSTIIVLFTAEFTPKSIFLLNPNNLLSLLAIPMIIIFFIMFPVVWLIEQMSKFIILFVLRQPYSEDRQVFGLTDLSNYIKQNTRDDIKKTKVELDTKIFNNALEFKTVRVRECMIPRTEISAIDIEDSVEDLKTEFIESGHTKILVYRESIDDVIGYCHVLDLFKKPQDIGSMLTPIIIVPETMLANELMIQFIQERKSLALVVDEFGGTSGIVSLEDVIEEIFGEIQDEHDEDEDWVEQRIDEDKYILSARHEIDYLNEKYKWDIPEGDYDTLGGFILSITESIPEVHDIIKHGLFEIKVVSMEDARIDNVLFIYNPDQED
ncbi:MULTISPECIES: hemolysin family protein [Roseivirga]|uniref:Hemolysin n=2 Tax=Roseivirga TaxID=290180 RepID=A0A150XGH7_9BACT|nr:MULTISPECIES: hemolysin family protein [Roseivirga]KYG77821.1 hemolysin [Roseivirga spongicola]MBO6661369.1 HlyC/CorC family transporter [Roseivirga sp.]MBO6759462.1 HlyC/CorC family transporter [Roseivirga sp.]MBO6908647.1 HlyC/CorC family transporter [Roseivirga sp.]WPZ11548.1 hemolysin family protein [Roseivirga spongicola]